jgi:hypothetical protein
MSIQVDVPANSRVLIESTGGMYTQSNAAGGYSAMEVFLVVDGGVQPPGQGYARLLSVNNAGVAGVAANLTNWSLVAAPTLAAGVHTIGVGTAGSNAGGANAIVGGIVDSVATPRLQVTILKL